MPRQTIVLHTILKRLGFLLSSLFLFLFFSSKLSADPWKEVAPGIDYYDAGPSLSSPWSHVHVFRIDLKQNQLDLIMAKSFSQPNASAGEFAQHSDALLSINGGFFDRNYHSLGLRMSHQQQYNPLKQISWWGVFYLKNNKPYISSVRQYHHEHVDFAVQSGPRLLIHGRIPSLKAGLAERSALGISPEGHVIMLVTESAPMTTTALAELMRRPPLNCQDALNLDGGSSSQLYAHMGSFKINVHGFSNVSDAIIVKPR
jgi:uncharacterized protein YigE (DUF2233 family)